MNKFRSADHPAAIFGTVTLEFFNNTDEQYKLRALKDLVKSLHKDFSVSVHTFERDLLENPERGYLTIALAAPSMDQANNLLDHVLKHLDAHAPARVISEDFERRELP